jgi:hypothetical protein
LNNDREIKLKTRLDWLWRDIKNTFDNTYYGMRNRRVWRKTMNGIRPWESFDGLLTVMQTHLRDFMEWEEKHGISVAEERELCIASVKETLEILERMKDPDAHYARLKDAVDARYPKYKSLIIRFKDGGSIHSGEFVAQGDGWAGQESGKGARVGYFEFVDDKFELAESPDPAETDRLLAELRQYHIDKEAAYRQAGDESDADFARLAELLHRNLFDWWD